jgi:hypothetical protein
MIAAEKEKTTSWLADSDEDDDLPDAGSLASLGKRDHRDNKVRMKCPSPFFFSFLFDLNSISPLYFSEPVQSGHSTHPRAISNPCNYSNYSAKRINDHQLRKVEEPSDAKCEVGCAC